MVRQDPKGIASTYEACLLTMEDDAADDEVVQQASLTVDSCYQIHGTIVKR